MVCVGEKVISIFVKRLSRQFKKTIRRIKNVLRIYSTCKYLFITDLQNCGIVSNVDFIAELNVALNEYSKILMIPVTDYKRNREINFLH